MRLELLDLEIEPELLVDWLSGIIGERAKPRKQKQLRLYKGLANAIRLHKARKTRKPQRRQSLPNRILDLDLYRSPKHYGASATDIAGALKTSPASVERALRDMAVKGQMHQSGVYWYKGRPNDWPRPFQRGL